MARQGGHKAQYPYHTSKDPARGWLTCHPAALAQGNQVSIAGRTSYITAYGSTSRQDVDLAPVRGVRGSASGLYSVQEGYTPLLH
jgi:hypothetical protein